MHAEEAEAIRKKCREQYNALIATGQTPIITNEFISKYTAIYHLRQTIEKSHLSINDYTALADTAADLSDNHNFIGTHNSAEIEKKIAHLEKSHFYAQQTIQWCAATTFHQYNPSFDKSKENNALCLQYDELTRYWQKVTQKRGALLTQIKSDKKRALEQVGSSSDSVSHKRIKRVYSPFEFVFDKKISFNQEGNCLSAKTTLQPIKINYNHIGSYIKTNRLYINTPIEKDKTIYSPLLAMVIFLGNPETLPIPIDFLNTLIQQMVLNGSDINAKLISKGSTNNTTSLGWLAYYNHLELVKYFLKQPQVKIHPFDNILSAPEKSVLRILLRKGLNDITILFRLFSFAENYSLNIYSKQALQGLNEAHKDSLSIEFKFFFSMITRDHAQLTELLKQHKPEAEWYKHETRIIRQLSKAVMNYIKSRPTADYQYRSKKTKLHTAIDAINRPTKRKKPVEDQNQGSSSGSSSSHNNSITTTTITTPGSLNGNHLDEDSDSDDDIVEINTTSQFIHAVYSLEANSITLINNIVTGLCQKKKLNLLTSIVALLHNQAELLTQWNSKLSERKWNIKNNPILIQIYELVYHYLTTLRHSNNHKYNAFMSKLNGHTFNQAVSEQHLRDLTMPLYLAAIPKRLIKGIMFLQSDNSSAAVINLEDDTTATYSTSAIITQINVTTPNNTAIELPPTENPSIVGTGTIDLTI